MRAIAVQAGLQILNLCSLVSSPFRNSDTETGPNPQSPVTMSHSVSYAESHSYEGPQRKQWLPQTVLITILSLAIASTVGVAMSAVVFSSAEDLGKPGNAVAQSFVMFSVSFSSL